LDNEFARKYFTLLLSQYRTMSKKVDDPAASAEAERIAKVFVTEMTWELIYGFEQAILKLEPLETLCRKAWILREKRGLSEMTNGILCSFSRAGRTAFSIIKRRQRGQNSLSDSFGSYFPKCDNGQHCQCACKFSHSPLCNPRVNPWIPRPGRILASG
jgi:hypothetical protein